MNLDKKPDSYESALEKAWESLDSLNPVELAKKSGASFDSEKKEFTLIFLNDEFHIKPSNRTVIGSKGQEARPFISVLLLHYLVYAKEIGLEGKLISFRELSGGDVYYNAFQRRAILPITNAFGSNCEALRAAGGRIHAEESDHGDISVKIKVFPRIPVTVILWEGDDEIPPSSNMLFDASIRELLPTEDVAVIGGFVASTLIKNIKMDQVE
ncbi:MAG: DUF3786 domain-containing protein [Candidatus Aminicenantes bacterium]|nr:MAG: DUF3786 domain-containing protein [Candidatus Aminicenantes bacterium]